MLVDQEQTNRHNRFVWGRNEYTDNDSPSRQNSPTHLLQHTIRSTFNLGWISLAERCARLPVASCWLQKVTNINIKIARPVQKSSYCKRFFKIIGNNLMYFPCGSFAYKKQLIWQRYCVPTITRGSFEKLNRAQRPKVRSLYQKKVPSKKNLYSIPRHCVSIFWINVHKTWSSLLIP